MTATTTEIEKAKAALEPFAIDEVMLQAWGDDEPFASFPTEDGFLYELTAGDLRRAREALSALQAPSAPAEMGGWKLVPVEPTEAMLDAAHDVPIDCYDDDTTCYTSNREASAIYRAMLKAAPAPDAEKDEIARLTAERDKCRSAHRELMQVYEIELAARTAAEGQVAALVEGLQPFAEVAEHDIGDDEADADYFRPMFRVNRAPNILVGHLRAARALLARIQPTLNGQEAGR